MKRNIRVIPQSVREKIRSLPRQIVAGVAKVVSLDSIRRGQWRHLGVRLSRAGDLVLPSSGFAVPPVDRGRYSRRNVEGEEVVRRDLPLETFYVSVDTPNWGDAATYGTHTVDLPNERYPREHIAPRVNRIKVSATESKKPGHVVVVFVVDEVLDKRSTDFDERLLECLNLLQENVESCGVQRADASHGDYVGTLGVNWEILPPGSKDEVLRGLFKGRRPTQEEREVATERYGFLAKLKPQNFVVGMSGVSRYLGALLRPNLVVFENMAYGNAVYVMFDDWEALSKRSRLELLSGVVGTNFERVQHKRGWKKKVRAIVRARLAA